MSISIKDSRRIIVGNEEFRWRVTGNDGFISIAIWKDGNHGGITGTFKYHSEFNNGPDLNGGYHLSKGQIIITNRVIRSLIEHIGIHKIIDEKRLINLGDLETIYDVDDALRQEL